MVYFDLTSTTIINLSAEYGTQLPARISSQDSLWPTRAQSGHQNEPSDAINIQQLTPSLPAPMNCVRASQSRSCRHPTLGIGGVRDTCHLGRGISPSEKTRQRRLSTGRSAAATAAQKYELRPVHRRLGIDVRQGCDEMVTWSPIPSSRSVF
ncbi:hypothetical protein IAQ61_010498 [Plenodomus lingam]|uniref:Predicted protein n=1 Tax=Leptosphaeria maculans (strain JN3 / isolate v23.1.3 / race Av1-4-5-6-7-8) TaxID=985895 RepID=E5A458_LEPMJ|nr:predicted protein [Plenodomus lingam JN3]KAH9862295.1 hypothetical protein IAQ61_010498 [Plenodomus lingam]CBX98403.1 predicted protein [Plenodomus lingam JN3]